MPDMNTGVVLLDFWSPMCGPCKRLAPIIEEIEDDYIQIDVIRINSMEDSETPRMFGVTSLPTLIFLKDGEVIETTVGIKTKEQISKIIDEII